MGLLCFHERAPWDFLCLCSVIFTSQVLIPPWKEVPKNMHFSAHLPTLGKGLLVDKQLG